MTTRQPDAQFHALCHEHHIEMRFTQVVVQAEHGQTEISTYACPQPDCGVRYTPSNGYFVVSKQAQVELDMTPRVICLRDGRPMYLAELNPTKRDFRLWRCPQCDSTRTNEEGLVNGVP